MSRLDKRLPHTGPEAERAQGERAAREAAALRENLLKRKAQARARAENPPEAGVPDAAETR